MAEIANELSAGVVSGAAQILPPEIISKISLLVDLSKLALIIVIIYFLVQIISSIFGANLQRKNYKILKNILDIVEEINKKLSLSKNKSSSK